MLSPDEIAALRSQPGFFEAARFMAVGITEMLQGSRALNVILSDRARFYLSLIALHLYWSGTPGGTHAGLTISRLKAVCAEQKLCSASRVEMVVAAMRLFNFARVEPDPYDQRIKLLIPSEKFVLGQMRRWRRQYTAMSRIMPEGKIGLEALKKPEFPPALCGKLCERLFSGARLVDPVPALEEYTKRNGGIPILLYLTANSAADPDNISQRLVNATISGLSKRFNVSRAHVRKLLDDAEMDGFLKRAGADSTRIVLLPQWIDAFETLYASTFLHMAHAARDALADIAKGTAKIRYGIVKRDGVLRDEEAEQAGMQP